MRMFESNKIQFQIIKLNVDFYDFCNFLFVCGERGRNPEKKELGCGINKMLMIKFMARAAPMRYRLDFGKVGIRSGIWWRTLLWTLNRFIGFISIQHGIFIPFCVKDFFSSIINGKSMMRENPGVEIYWKGTESPVKSFFPSRNLWKELIKRTFKSC